MYCPDCKKAMIILEYKEIEVDFCPHCKGCWLDEGELEQILHGRDEAMRLVNGTGGRRGNRRCPRCTERMRVTALPGGGPEIDMCPASCGMWFDQGELRALVRAHLSANDAADVVRSLTEMFGTPEESRED